MVISIAVLVYKRVQESTTMFMISRTMILLLDSWSSMGKPDQKDIHGPYFFGNEMI